MSDKKIKIITLSDNPLFFSGVGTQTKYIIDGWLNSGKFKVLSIGGQARPVQDPRVVKVSEDWEIIPTQGYGNREMLQSIMRKFKPDILFFFTDPRFWEWLWLQEKEIRPFVPMVYYHVWDNYPEPYFNKQYYESCDYVINMSKVTQDMVQKVAPGVYSEYVPLSVDTDIFRKLDTEEVSEFKNSSIPNVKDKFVIFWNNRNGARKLPATLLFWYKEFLEAVGKNKACLVMNTDPRDEVGTNLEAVVENLGLVNGEVIFSPRQVDTETLVKLYNSSDVVINISHSEGFGLGTLEALSCEIPIIVNKTGGLQEQVIDGINGFGLEPKIKTVVGSLAVPYIYQDYCSKEDFLEALHKIYNMSKEERQKMGVAGRQHVLKNYNFKNFQEKWVNIMENVYEKDGSWEQRKNYLPYDIVKF